MAFIKLFPSEGRDALPVKDVIIGRIDPDKNADSKPNK